MKGLGDIHAGPVIEQQLWVAIVPTALNPREMQRLRAELLKINRDRLRCMRPGPEKELFRTALGWLEQGKLTQHVPGDERVLYQSTEKMRPDRTIFAPLGLGLESDRAN